MPYLLLEGLDALPRTLVALPVLLVGAASFIAFVPRGKTDDGHDWTGQATIGLATAALGALCVPLMQ